MHGDIRPELAKCVRQAISHYGVAIFRGDISEGAILGRVVGSRNRFRHSAAQQLGDVKAFVPAVIGSDEDRGERVDRALEMLPLPKV